jgi:hypothetical protein
MVVAPGRPPVRVALAPPARLVSMRIFMRLRLQRIL